MSDASIVLAAILTALPAAPLLMAKAPSSTAARAAAPQPRRWTVTLQTGVAETFQLTLGGVFGEGPAWQNRVTLGTGNLFLTGNSLAVSGWDTHDMSSGHDDWTGSVSYKVRAYRHGNHSLHLGGGLERWKFPSVLTGASDWIAAYNAAYATRLGTAPFQLQSTVYNTLSSTLKEGTLIHSQAWFEHPVFNREPMKLVFRHGPQHTYSWNFYGTNGHRILRYAGALQLTAKQTQLEAGVRPQYGLQRRIPDNRFWYVMLSRTF